MASRAWIRRLGHSLADRLDRLRVTFDTLRERVRAAVSEAVGQTIASAVHEAVHAVLGEVDAAQEGSPRFHHPSPSWWREPDNPSWSDHQDAWREPAEEYESATDAASSPLLSQPAQLRQALVVGCESAALWLRSWTGRFPLASGLIVGVASAALAHVGGPLATASIGLIGSFLGLTSISKAIRSGAAALDPFRGP